MTDPDDADKSHQVSCGISSSLRDAAMQGICRWRPRRVAPALGTVQSAATSTSTSSHTRSARGRPAWTRKQPEHGDHKQSTDHPLPPRRARRRKPAAVVVLVSTVGQYTTGYRR